MQGVVMRGWIEHMKRRDWKESFLGEDWNYALSSQWSGMKVNYTFSFSLNIFFFSFHLSFSIFLSFLRAWLPITFSTTHFLLLRSEGTREEGSRRGGGVEGHTQVCWLINRLLFVHRETDTHIWLYIDRDLCMTWLLMILCSFPPSIPHPSFFPLN